MIFKDDKYNQIFANLEELSKADMSLLDALKVTRQHNPQAGEVLARHIYTDTMVPKVGNNFAYKDFLSRNRNSGIHLSLDANSFGAINKEHGFETGNDAIKQLFGTVSEVSRKYGLKTFRVGGDEGRLHAPTPERANGFMNELTQRLNSSPALKGTQHKLSVSVGMGYTPEHAEQALIRAKDKLGPLVGGKRQKIHPPGAEPTVSHSLLSDAPPTNWMPATGKFPDLPHEEKESLAPPGLKFANPLKVKGS